MLTFHLPQSEEVKRDSSFQPTEKVGQTMTEKPSAPQRKKRVFTEEEEKDVNNEVIQNKVSKQPTSNKIIFVLLH